MCGLVAVRALRAGSGRTIRGAPIHSSRFDDRHFRHDRRPHRAVRWWLIVGRRADRADGAGRRRDAADRIRAVDRRMEAGHRHAAAADRRQQWTQAFEAYKTIPQYRELNAGMTLAEFKTIFWWEWSHRLLGRVIGVAYLLPFLFFLWRGALSARSEAAAVADLRARRAAGRGRLVDGGVGPVASGSRFRNIGSRRIWCWRC